MTFDTDRPRFGQALLSEWLLDDSITFLNHRSFGATPRRVMAEQDVWRKRLKSRPGGLWIRVSAQVYNDLADYERLAVALAK